MVSSMASIFKKVLEDRERIIRTGHSAYTPTLTPPPNTPTELFGVPFKKEKTETDIAIEKAAQVAPLPPATSMLRLVANQQEKLKPEYEVYQSVIRNQQKYYQGLLNKGEMTEAQANSELNKVVREFQKGTYEQRGYKVTEVTDETGNVQLQLEKEVQVPQQKQTTTIKLNPKEKIRIGDIFTGTWVLKAGSRLFPTGTATTIKGENLGFLTPSENIKKTQVTYGLIGGVAKRIEETKAFKKYAEKNTWITSPFTVMTPIGRKTITPQGLNLFARNVGLGVFFSPAMRTGTQAQQVQQEMEAGYEFVGYTKDGRMIRRNLITRKLEVQNVDVYIGGTQGVYKARFGGKEYFVYPDGRIVPVNKEPVVIKVVGALFPKTKPIISDLYPSMVGGTGTQGTSLWTGTGQYETNILQGVGQMEGAGSILGGLSQSQLNIQKQVQETKQVQSNIPLTVFNLKKAQSPIQPIPPRNVSGLATGLSLAQPTVQVQPQPQISISRTRQLYKPFKLQTPINTYKFKPPKPPIIKKPQLLSLIGKSKSKSKDIFGAFIKRYKKDISLGSFKELKGAKTKLVSELKSTLGASGFVTKGKSKVPFKELELGYEFTPAKKDMFRVVQRRGFRLGTRSEVSEILSAKRAKGRKIKWL